MAGLPARGAGTDTVDALAVTNNLTGTIPND